MDQILMAILFEGLYCQMAERAKAKGLPPISRTSLWLLVMRQVGVSPSKRAVKALLHLGPELEQMFALARSLRGRGLA